MRQHLRVSHGGKIHDWAMTGSLGSGMKKCLGSPSVRLRRTTGFQHIHCSSVDDRRPHFHLSDHAVRKLSAESQDALVWHLILLKSGELLQRYCVTHAGQIHDRKYERR